MPQNVRTQLTDQRLDIVDVMFLGLEMFQQGVRERA